MKVSFVLAAALALTVAAVPSIAGADECSSKYSGQDALAKVCKAGQEAKAHGDPTTCAKMSIAGSRENKAVLNACQYGYDHAEKGTVGRLSSTQESEHRVKPVKEAVVHEASPSGAHAGSAK